MIGVSFCAQCRAAHPPGEHVDRRVVASAGSATLPELGRLDRKDTAVSPRSDSSSGHPPQNSGTGDGVIWSQRAQEGHVEFLDGRKATATFNPGCACCQERRRQNAKHQRDFKEKRKREKRQ